MNGNDRIIGMKKIIAFMYVRIFNIIIFIFYNVYIIYNIMYTFRARDRHNKTNNVITIIIIIIRLSN